MRPRRAPARRGKAAPAVSGTRGREKSPSPDYPLLARTVIEKHGEISGEAGACKLPAGLYVVATPIGNLGDISLRALTVLAGADLVACEDTRVSGGLLTRYGLRKQLFAYHDHNEATAAGKILAMISGGDAVALISDAGMPLVSDPGFRLVHACREAGLPVTVVPGACAAVTALAGAGLASDSFCFAGFLSAKSAARRKELERLRGIAGTLVIYEAPQRIAETLSDAAHILGEVRMAAVSRELTKMFEETRRGSLGELARLYGDGLAETRGEFVVMVEAAAQEENRLSDAGLEERLSQALTSQSLRDAVDSVSAATGARRSDVYKLALRIAAKDEG